MRCWIRAIALCCLVGCGQTDGCGATGDYAYPRTDPDAALTQRAIRVRISQMGLDTVAGSVAGVIAAQCGPNPTDGSSSCALDPLDENKVRFYIQNSDGSAVNLSAGQVRLGSFFALDLASLEDGIDVGLLSSDDGRDGFQVTLGCDPEAINGCPSSSHVNGSVDMVLFMEAPSLSFWEDSTCFVQDADPPLPGLKIRSFRFSAYPHVELGQDMRPYLILDDDDVVVEQADIELEVVAGKASWDPVCQADSDNCDMCDDLDFLLDWVLDPLVESGTIAEMLAQELAQRLLGSYSDEPVDIEGGLRTADLLSFANPDAEPVLYRGAVNAASPHVSGLSYMLGYNFDFDAGFVAEHDECVPSITPPSWDLPVPDEPPGTIVAPDPLTLEPTPEPYDAVVLAGDVLLGRALHVLFEGGSFCLPLSAERLQEVTGGAFTPTVATLSLIVPGLASLGPENAPVDLNLTPKRPAQVSFGTGDGEGSERDSHLQVFWPRLGLEVYPWTDESFVRALAIECDLDIGLSVVPTPNGNLQVFVDRMRLDSVVVTYNEINLDFDPEDLAAIVETLVPSFISGAPHDVALTADLLGFPFVPKVRAVEPVGPGTRYLGIYMRFCAGREINNPDNALCYEGPADGGRSVSPRFSAVPLEPGSLAAPNRLTLRVFANLPPESLEVAVRVDHGAYLAFAPVADDGRLTVEHPWLRLEGEHRLELIARERARPGHWSQPVEVLVQREREVAPAEVESGAPVRPRSYEDEPSVRAPSAGGCTSSSSGLYGLLCVCALWAWRRGRHPFGFRS